MNTLSNRKIAYVVLGMHRSGTSAVSGFLNKMGIAFGTNLLMPDYFNEKGYFENALIVSANDNIFQTLGSSWDDLFLLEEEWWLRPQLIPHRDAVKKIIEQEFSATELFCIKDPRISILLPFWISILQELNIDISFIIPLRHPIEVAESLKARDGFSIEKGVLLWMNNMLSIEYFSRPFKRSFFTFNDFLKSPEKTIQCIFKNNDIVLPNTKLQTDDTTSEFVDPKLRHHNIKDLNFNGDVLSLIDRFNIILLKLGKNVQSNKKYFIAVDEIRCEYTRLCSVFYNRDIRNAKASQQFRPKLFYSESDHVFEERKKVMACAMPVGPFSVEFELPGNGYPYLRFDPHEGRFAQVSIYNVTVETSEGKIYSIDKQDLECNGEKVNSCTWKFHHDDPSITIRLNAAIKKVSITGDMLFIGNDLLQKEIINLNLAMTERDNQIISLGASAAEREGQITVLNQAVAEREGQITVLNQVVAEREGQITVLNQAVAECEGQITGLTQNISALYAQISNLNENFNAVSSELNMVLSSRSWLFTKPLRTVNKYWATIANSSKLNRRHHFIGLIWRHIPLTINQKQRLKAILFKILPFLTSWYETYRIRQKQGFSGPIYESQTAISRVFDGEYYLYANPDVAVAGIDPLSHFCGRGWREGRNPHPLFNTIYYLQHYPDVLAAGINPLEHYLCRGWLEGRDPHPVFDAAYYSKAGWYSIKCGISPLEYYLKHRCAATGKHLAGFDALLPRLQDNPPASCEPADSTQLEIMPLISILLPSFNTPAKYLDACINSVLAQRYENWELCVTDDGSTAAETRNVLERFSQLDSRIRVNWLERNSGISSATNDALNRAHGEYVAMLDHDDTLEPDALLAFVREINSHPDKADVIYSDQDRITAEGERVDIYYKPDWSPELMRGVMYVGHLLMVRRLLAIDAGGFNSNFDGVQDFEFMLRVSECTNRITHIPKILYHWRMIAGSIAHNGDSKGKVEPLQCAAVNAHMARLGLTGQAAPHPMHSHRALILPLQNMPPPSMTVIIGQIATPEHLDRCLDSLMVRGIETEVLLLSDGGLPAYRSGLKVKCLPSPSASGNKNMVLTQLFIAALKEARGEFVLFLERPVILSPGWIDRLSLYAGRPHAGLVSPLVLNVDGTVAEAGLLLHPHLGVAPAMSGWNSSGDGQAGSLSCAREVSMASASCVCFRRSLLQEIGGFDSLYCCISFLVADASLKAMSLGMCNLYVPTVTAKHCGSISHANTADESLDRGLFMDRWSNHLKEGDRYHNPNYCPDNGGYAPL